MHGFRWHFGGNGDFVTVAILQGFADNDLRCAAQVYVSGIKIGDAAVDRVADEADGFFLVDHAVAGGLAVKAHAAQAEGGALDAELSIGAVFHVRDLLQGI